MQISELARAQTGPAPRQARGPELVEWASGLTYIENSPVLYSDRQAPATRRVTRSRDDPGVKTPGYRGLYYENTP